MGLPVVPRRGVRPLSGLENDLLQLRWEQATAAGGEASAVKKRRTGRGGTEPTGHPPPPVGKFNGEGGAGPTKPSPTPKGVGRVRSGSPLSSPTPTPTFTPATLLSCFINFFVLLFFIIIFIFFDYIYLARPDFYFVLLFILLLYLFGGGFVKF